MQVWLRDLGYFCCFFDQNLLLQLNHEQVFVYPLCLKVSVSQLPGLILLTSFQNCFLVHSGCPWKKNQLNRTDHPFLCRPSKALMLVGHELEEEAMEYILMVEVPRVVDRNS
jgi:hypothetical protein